jgi:hypothetical protein
LTLHRPLVETNITTKSIVNFYYYNWRDLWLSYGLALGFALLANILGGVAFWINRVAHDRSFSALLSSTRNAKLAMIFNPETLGKLPLQGDVAKTPLKFEVMGKEGGLGLTLVETKPAEDEPAGDEPAEDDPVAVDSEEPRTTRVIGNLGKGNNLE